LIYFAIFSSFFFFQTPMAFYPTWQTTATPATTEQAWQNQFIQQIPQNGSAPSVTATAIAPLNSIDFQQVKLKIKISLEIKY
jgi:hypothetical protein